MQTVQKVFRLPISMLGAFAVLTALFGFAEMLLAAPPEQAKAAAAGPFETSLFDGRSLAGWTIENDCEVGVDEGLLVLQSGNGWLRTDHTYADFALHVEWKALQRADYDSGIYIRSSRGGNDASRDGYEVDLREGDEGRIGSLQRAAVKGLVKPGEWNTFDITAIGETIALTINGKDAYKASGLMQRSGYVGLKCAVSKGGKFQFRNLRITELEHRPLFNGIDLTGWSGAGEPAEKCWKVVDGQLVCTGKPGPWLRTQEQYGDFDLRLEYLVAPGGNSGVYVRVPEDGNHHRDDAAAPPAGFEVQILDDAAAAHRNIRDYQYSASVYDIAGANPRTTKPPGQWNTLEIDCRRQHVTISQNGAVVVEINDETHPLLKLRQTKGFLGLQNHNTEVKFRNIRLQSHP